MSRVGTSGSPTFLSSFQVFVPFLHSVVEAFVQEAFNKHGKENSDGNLCLDVKRVRLDY